MLLVLKNVKKLFLLALTFDRNEVAASNDDDDDGAKIIHHFR